MGDIWRFVLTAVAAAMLVAAAFASVVAAQEPLPISLTLDPPPPELTETVEVVGWGVVVVFAWITSPLVGLLLYIATLMLVHGDRNITAPASAIILMLFAPLYTLIRAGLGGRKR